VVEVGLTAHAQLNASRIVENSSVTIDIDTCAGIYLPAALCAYKYGTVWYDVE
jgi:hypothetical protein